MENFSAGILREKNTQKIVADIAKCPVACATLKSKYPKVGTA
jgi:hypothetical protein